MTRTTGVTMSAAPDDRSARIEPAGSAGSPFDVVALVTSAGGLSALNQVLMPLPDDFGAALVIVQHLGGPGSSLVEILRRRCPLPVQWIADRDPLRPFRLISRDRASACPMLSSRPAAAGGSSPASAVGGG